MPARENGGCVETQLCFAAPGSLVLCLGAAKCLAPPGGALRQGLVPAGWGALGRCLLARFGGETAPPLVHLSGLFSVLNSQLQPTAHCHCCEEAKKRFQEHNGRLRTMHTKGRGARGALVPVIDHTERERARSGPETRHCFTYIGSPNGPVQRPNPVRYVQYECYETTARSETRKLARVRPARCPA
jgi:hypothetical protein